MMSLVAVIRIHLRMASVTNKSVFSIITTTLVVVGTCPKLKFKSSSKRHPLCITIMLAYRPGLFHTAVKRVARAQFQPKLSLNKVLNFRKFLLSSLKLRQSLKS